MGIRNSMRKAVEELQDEDEPDPVPRSSSSRRSDSFFTQSYDYYRPPKDDMQEYWRAFETMPFVRQSITAFAREVVEPGWWVQAESDKTAKRLAEWLRQCAIVEGEKNQDLALLLKKIVVQREVRGTVLIEHVPERNDDESIAGLKLINPETVTTFTKENSTVLLDPNDPVPEELRNRDMELDDTPAYVQFFRETFESRDEVPFTTEQMTKVVRDADVGEVYGTSRLETVLTRINALREKLQDKDAAIKNKAWPVWIFGFGPEDDPWHPDDIDDFMEEEDANNFTPGTKHGVQGDINVQTVGGDVPELQESIDYDVNHIISALPMPKFATGFAEDINQFVSQQQENRIRRQVREARRELEYELQRILEMKAEELGLDTEGLHLKIQPPQGEDPMSVYEQSGTTIRYISNAGNEGFGTQSDGKITNQFDPEFQQKQQGDSGNPNSGSEQSESWTRDVEELRFPDEGDTVDTPDGKGVVAAEMSETFKWPPTGKEVEASRGNEAYVVGLVDGGSAVYRADDLEETSFKGGQPHPGTAMDAEMGSVYSKMDSPRSLAYHMIEPEAPDLNVAELEAVAGSSNPRSESGLDSLPKGWTRKTVLKWWSSVGGTWSQCHDKLKGDISSRRAREHCAAMKDEVVGFTEWRGTF